jgi:glutaredoxin
MHMPRGVFSPRKCPYCLASEKKGRKRSFRYIASNFKTIKKEAKKS